MRWVLNAAVLLLICCQTPQKSALPSEWHEIGSPEQRGGLEIHKFKGPDQTALVLKSQTLEALEQPEQYFNQTLHYLQALLQPPTDPYFGQPDNLTKPTTSAVKIGPRLHKPDLELTQIDLPATLALNYGPLEYNEQTLDSHLLLIFCQRSRKFLQVAYFAGHNKLNAQFSPEFWCDLRLERGH